MIRCITRYVDRAGAAPKPFACCQKSSNILDKDAGQVYVVFARLLNNGQALGGGPS
jgi:hypothetical protein